MEINRDNFEYSTWEYKHERCSQRAQIMNNDCDIWNK